jgi:hypothetical protein
LLSAADERVLALRWRPPLLALPLPLLRRLLPLPLALLLLRRLLALDWRLLELPWPFDELARRLREPLLPLDPLRLLEPLDALRPLEPLRPLDALRPLEPLEPLEALRPLEPLDDLRPLEPLDALRLLDPLFRALAALWRAPDDDCLRPLLDPLLPDEEADPDAEVERPRLLARFDVPRSLAADISPSCFRLTCSLQRPRAGLIKSYPRVDPAHRTGRMF